MNKLTLFTLVVSVVALLCGGIAWYGLLHLHLPSLGGTTNLNDLVVDTLTSAGITNTVNEAITGQLTVAGTYNSSGTTTGAGTTIVKRVCSSTTVNPPSMGPLATSTWDVPLTGATTSLNQAFSWGFATSSQIYIGSIAPASTTGVVTLTYQNMGTIINITTTTLNVCYDQF